MRFSKVMHDYQKRAVKYLLDHKYSGLFLDPGLGKTASYLLYTKLVKKYFGVKKTLVIAPKRVCYITWPDEIAKWDDFSGLSYTILHGRDKEQNLKKDVDIYFINPEGLAWLSSKLKNNRKHNFDVLCVDESTKFKNWSAKRTKILVKMLRYFKRRHIMTGTPAPKNLIDLFSQIYILDRGKTLGKGVTRFKNTYFTYDSYSYSYDLIPGCDKIIYNKIAPMVLQMSANEYLELPSLLYNKIYIELPDKAMTIYDDLENKLFAEIDADEVSLVNGSAAYNACKQIVSGALYRQQEYFPTNTDTTIYADKSNKRDYYEFHMEKIEALKELYEGLQGKPLMVVYSFNHDLERLQKAFKDTKYIGRGISDKEGIIITNDWNAGKIDLLFVHPASMSHGLNMQKCGRDICWFSLTDNLEEYDQLNRRIYRQGVDSTVTIHHIMAKNTVDEAIYARNLKKSQTQNDLRRALKMYRENKLKKS